MRYCSKEGSVVAKDRTFNNCLSTGWKKKNHCSLVDLAGRGNYRDGGSFSIIVRADEAAITSPINRTSEIAEIDLFPVCNRYFTLAIIPLLYARFRAQ